MDVLNRLRKLQKEYGWSDYRIAKEAGLSNGTVSNIYKRNTVPTIDTLEKICGAFGLTLSQFFATDDMVELSPELKNLFQHWVKLPAETKIIVLQLMKSSERA